MTEQVSIGIELPTGASALVEGVVADLGKDASIDLKQPKVSGDTSADLTFDPVSGLTIGWFLLKVTGEAAIALTGAIIGELVHKRLQERKALARKTVRLRFPDGAVYNLVVDDPQSMARLQQMIAERALR
ncbi:hypothetical protein CO669_33035 [Bradyrhizobium sp. Y36]|uniref:hypothetical protein n=1 Tax=Bradyrhizobium sp. Y36 TaxID=2035447 RepID=UPI000BE7E126|nr:hypothetical protein [Bradyrhizobium sp. Y36]PDT83636.1 hypothetical protein CO669_33035 [Bradyrhizobium sp. Y36]